MLSCEAQVLVVAPTREIALQVGDVISSLGARLPAPGLALGTFIGGLPTEEDVRRLRRCPPTAHFAHLSVCGRAFAYMRMILKFACKIDGVLAPSPDC